MKNPNHEFESVKNMRKYLSNIGSELHFQALKRIVNKFNSGQISGIEADQNISTINDIRKKYLDIKSVRYTPISIQNLEEIYLASSSRETAVDDKKIH
ncbi:MAG: hypothetical protein WBN37_00860 [Arenicellales bacterium]